MKAFLILSCAVLAVTAVPSPGKSKRDLFDNYLSYNSVPQDYYSSYYNPITTYSNGLFANPIISQEVNQHTVHNVVNKVPVAVPQPIAFPVTKTVKVPQLYPVAVEKAVPVGLRVNVPYPVDKPYAVEVPQHVPYPVKVKIPYAVEKPYPVTITKTVPIKVEKPVYVRVPEVVKVPVAQPYPVPIQRKVSVSVPEPVVFRVPEQINVQQPYYQQVNWPEYGFKDTELVQSQPPCPLTQGHDSYTYGSYSDHNIFSRSATKKH